MQKLLLLITSMGAFAQQPPNILLINIDDLGWMDVGFMGSEYYNTPNIDALAAEGMVFTNAYASAANPGEQNNVAEANPDIVKELSELMKSARTESEIFLFS